MGYRIGSMGLWIGALVLGCAETNRGVMHDNTPMHESAPSAESSGSGGNAGSETAGNTEFHNPANPTGDAGWIGSVSKVCDPWYHCECRGPLLGGGRSFGACEGECTFELSFSYAIVLDVGDCAGVFANLIVHDTSGVMRRFHASLTEMGWERVATISRDLSHDLSLLPDPATECPECASERADWVALSLGNPERAVDFHYEQGNPPEALRAAAALVEALIDQVRTCDGELIASCGARVVTGDPRNIGCELHFDDQARSVTCELRPGIDAPCREVAACLCSVDLLEPGHLQQEACVSAWLTAGEQLTLGDLCAAGEASAEESVTDVLGAFADDRGWTYNSSGECAGMRAFY